MRRALVIGLIAFAGCGEAERPASTVVVKPPGKGTVPLGEPATPRAEVPAGRTGVMGLDGRVGVRPERLAIAEDAELERIRWATDAEGVGRLALLECDPTCASGRVRSVPARIRLSDPVDCPDGRFYDRATVTIEGRIRRQPTDVGGVRGEELPPPMVFIQAPC